MANININIKKPFFNINDGFKFGKIYDTNSYSNKTKKNYKIKKIISKKKIL